MDVISKVIHSNITKSIICSITLLVAGFYFTKKVKKKEKKVIYYDCAFIYNKGIRIYKENSNVPTEIRISSDNLLPGTHLFTSFLEKAESNINLCFYGLTSKTIINSIIEQKKKGRQVNLIIDNSCLRNEQIARMRHLGIKIYTNRKHDQGSLMHHKFIIIDESAVFITSMNPTTSAFCGNFENIIMTNDEEVVSQYLNHYKIMKKKLFLI